MTSKLSEKLQKLKDDISEDGEQEFVDSIQKEESTSTRESSPLKETLKETLLNRFSSKFSTNSPSTVNQANSSGTSVSINDGDLVPILSTEKSSPDLNLQESENQKGAAGGTWLHTVKGRIAKTVEEKYTEYKNEKEMRKLQQQPNAHSSNLSNQFNIDGSFDDFLLENDDADEDVVIEEKDKNYLTHSLSEDVIAVSKNFDDQCVDDSNIEDMMVQGRRSSTPVSTENSQQTSPKEKRRFTFGFLERKPAGSTTATPGSSSEAVTSSPAAPSSTGTTPKTSTPNPTAPLPAGSTTPTKSSLRSRMIEKFMGKSPGGAALSSPITIDKSGSFTDNQHSGSSSPPKLDDPFSGLELISSSPDKNVLNNTTNDNLEAPNDNNDSDIETAVEADEFLILESGDNSETLTHQIDDVEVLPENILPPETFNIWSRIQGQWWTIGFPLCILLFFQLMPLPTWIVGFLTGILVGVPTAAYITYNLMDDETPKTPFLENISRKKAARPAIIVQEELKRVYTWMNLWPSKKGPYDPLTYDIRRTISVRIMLHGPWLEMRFPKRNLPLRRMCTDTELTNIEFHEHVEVVDLSTCSIDLQPENLPTKRIWSKKYPIRIRPNTRKPYSTQEATKKMAAKKDIKDEAELDLDKEPEDDEDEIMLDAKENLEDYSSCDITTTTSVDKNHDTFDESAILDKENEDKVFTLFTRTAREKEEWFNHLLVAAKFMEDYERQNPKEGSPVDPDYETQKVKDQKYKMFLEDYPQAKNETEARQKHEELKSNPELFNCAKDQTAFLNIFFGRMWHDLHSNKAFNDFLREKITRKLLKVKISQYFDNVTVTTLDLGPKLPQLLSCSLPWQDELGLWFDVDVEFKSICTATVQTQGIRLPAKDEPDREAAELLSRQAAVLDSDEEDSAEVHFGSSSWQATQATYLNSSLFGVRQFNNQIQEDDDLPPDQVTSTEENSGPTTPGNGPELPPLPGFKARLVEGILRSDFVAKMAESEWVKKNITSKNITLQLQLHSIKGTLRVNFPPAPSDRIWYGFREPPYLDLALRPCFGGHSLGKYEGTISTVMKHLEKRLKLEFIKVLVCPNMDDEIFPFLHHVPYSLTGTNSNQQPTSIYVPKIKPSQSLQSFSKNNSSFPGNGNGANGANGASSLNTSNITSFNAAAAAAFDENQL